MTKKDFIALADVVKDARPTDQGQMPLWEDIRDRLADFCAASNPRFNRSRWIDYIDGTCGPSGGKVHPVKN